MQRLLIVMILAVTFVLAGGVGLGFYRGWFTFAVDNDRIKADKDSVVEKVDDLTHPAKDRTTIPADKR